MYLSIWRILRKSVIGCLDQFLTMKLLRQRLLIQRGERGKARWEIKNRKLAKKFKHRFIQGIRLSDILIS